MDYWLKQSRDSPIFPELLWSQPESKHARGKLAIIGGNSFGFAVIAAAYTAAQKAGIGSVRVLLPDAVKKVIGPLLPDGEFAPSNLSGSFSQQALAELLDLAEWADAALIAGDLGRNSETAILLEKFIVKYTGLVILTKDAVDYFTSNSALIIDRPDTTVVLSLAQLQKLLIHARSDQAITFGMDLIKLVEVLHAFTAQHNLEIVVKHLDNMIIAVSGQVSTTKLDQDTSIWRVETAARAAVWRLQNHTKPFQALTTSVADNK